MKLFRRSKKVSSSISTEQFSVVKSDTTREVIVLGPGCTKCKTTFQLVSNFIKEHELDAVVSKEDDIMKIMEFNVMSTPALVVDGKVMMTGRVPKPQDLSEILL